MWKNTDVRAVIAEIVRPATAVLTNEKNAALTDESTMNLQLRADSAIKSVNAMVQRFDKAFAGAVADEAMQVFKKFYSSHLAQMPGGSVFGRDGIKELTWLSGRIAGTSQGDLAVAGFVTLNAWDAAAVGEAKAGGAGDAYLIAYAAYVKTQTGDASFVPRSLAEARVALQSKLDSDMRALAEHSKEMAWVAKNVCEPLGPELGKKAMDGYLASTSDEWKKEDEALRSRVVESRDRLVRHMIALNKIGPGLAPSMSEQWEAISTDPVACQAIVDALENDPDLIKGDGLKDVAGLLATIQKMIQKEKRPLGQLAFLAVRMTNVTATAFMRRTVLEKLDGLRPDDPAGAVKIAQALAGLRNKWFAKILGWSEADLDQAVAIVNEAAAGYARNTMLLETEVDPDGIAQLDAAVIAQLDAAVTAKFTTGMNTLESRMAAFNGATIAGRMMKSLVAAMGIYIYTWGSLQATIA